MKIGNFLIADDSAEKIAMLTALIERAGWSGTTFIAQTTEEAMETIDLEPDIAYAFIDYYIPHHHGPAVIKYLKQKHPRVRIALVSSGCSEANSKEARDSGAEAIICTSDPQDQVEFEVRRVLEEWFE